MTAVHSDDLELLERLGGSDAVVHRATVRGTGRVVVVKAAPWSRPDVADRLGREAAVLERVATPGLVRLLGRADDATSRRLVLVHAPGGSLADHLASGGPLRPSEVADLGARLAATLVALHRAGVVHRDVHPGNVLLDAELQPVLADLDRALDPSAPPLPGDDEVVGHPAHVDHRLFAGAPVGPGSDLHALATTLWTAATGAPPQRDAPDAPVRMADHPLVPPALDAVLRAAVDGEADHAADLAVRLAGLAGDLRDEPAPPVDLGALPPPVLAGVASAGPQLPPMSAASPVVATSSASGTRSWGPAPARRGGPVTARPWSAEWLRGRAPVVVAGAIAVGAITAAAALAAARPSSPDGTGAAGPGPTVDATTVVVPPPPCASDDTDSGPDPVVADLDGDGCSERLTLEDGVLTTPDGTFALGEPGDVLLAGDWDGDGRWSVGLHRPSTGMVYLFDGPPGPGATSRPPEQGTPGAVATVVATPEGHRVVTTG